MSKERIIPGINIQWPWSQLLLSGEKTIETRSYPIPDKYIGQDLAVIETPGRDGKKKAGITTAQVIGIINFGQSKQYLSKASWLKDASHHCVKPDDPMFAYKEDTLKFGWPVLKFTKFKTPKPAPKKRGIVFASACQV